MPNVRPTNGVSFGVAHEITSAEATADSVLFDFGVYYSLVATVIQTDASGVQIDAVTNPLTITYPAAGQVQVDGTFTAGELLHLVAQRDYNSAT